MWIKRGVRNARRGPSAETQLTVSGPKASLVAAVLQPRDGKPPRRRRPHHPRPDASVLETYAGLMDAFDPNFQIVVP